MKEWVKSAIHFAKIDQAKLARGLSEKLGLPDDRSIVNKIVKGSRSLRADEMLAIAQITGYPIPGHQWPNEALASAGVDLVILEKALEVTYEALGLDPESATDLAEIVLQVAQDAHLHAGALAASDSARVLASAAVARFLKGFRSK